MFWPARLLIVVYRRSWREIFVPNTSDFHEKLKSGNGKPMETPPGWKNEKRGDSTVAWISRSPNVLRFPHSDQQAWPRSTRKKPNGRIPRSASRCFVRQWGAGVPFEWLSAARFDRFSSYGSAFIRSETFPETYPGSGLESRRSQNSNFNNDRDILISTSWPADPNSLRRESRKSKSGLRRWAICDPV